MNVFFEFHKVVRHFQREDIEYALVGGVAVAFHAEPRFTKDVDFLIPGHELEKVSEVLKQEGYFRTAEPWTFKESKLTLHRFMKIENQDEMIIDVLVAGDERHEKIITNALIADSPGTGEVKVATKEDLIWLKKFEAGQGRH